MKLKYILLISIFINLNSTSKFGNFFKKVGHTIAKPFKNIAHISDFKKDIKKIKHFVSKLKN